MIFKLFRVFFKIGAFTFGGGYAMIPIIQEEIVDKNKWMENEEFLDAIAVAQASPGPVSVNTSIFVGYKIGGISGAISCLLGTVLPSFLTILLVAMFFYQYRNNPIIDKVFMGIRPAVVALILSAVYKLGKSMGHSKPIVLIALATVLLIVFVDISPILLILAGGIGAVFYFKGKEKGS